MARIIALLLCLMLFGCDTSHSVFIRKQPCLIPNQGTNFSLCEDFIFHIDDNTYIIPKGFDTDLASIPRIFWVLDAPNDTDTIPGAIIHDFMYRNSVRLTRKEADSIFYDVLIDQGASSFTALKFWIGVRLFGASHFHGK